MSCGMREINSETPRAEKNFRRLKLNKAKNKKTENSPINKPLINLSGKTTVLPPESVLPWANGTNGKYESGEL